MSKAVMYGINRTYVPNTQADRASKKWVKKRRTQQKKQGMFKQVLRKKMEDNQSK